jgi:hypothetical protein
MELDTIIVLSLALVFFGGITYLIWKERNNQKPHGAEIQALLHDNQRPIEKLDRRKP